MIHGVVALAAAAMTPAPPMQRKAVLAVIAVRPIRAIRPILALRAVLTLPVLRGLLRLAAGDE